MRRLILPSIALSVMLAVPTAAAEKVTPLDRFKLWNGCQPMHLLVEPLHDGAKAIGLSKSRVERAVSGRLRTARIYTDERATPYVYVNLNVVDQAFSVLISLQKFVKDSRSGELGIAPTWERGATGLHGKDGSYLLSAIGEFTDVFIDEYLRVNAAACRNSN